MERSYCELRSAKKKALLDYHSHDFEPSNFLILNYATASFSSSSSLISITHNAVTSHLDTQRTA